MSPLTYWLAIGALVLAAAFVANAIAYRIRFGTFLRVEKRREFVSKGLSKAELAMSMVFVLALLAGITVPTFAPTSPFAHWLQEPYSQLVYAVWCFLAFMVAGAALAVFRALRKEAS